MSDRSSARRRLVWYPEVADDLRRLPRSSLQVIARDLLIQIKQGSEHGRPLSTLARTGDLSDCRKVYFDDRDGPPRYRIVFRERIVETVEIVEIVVIGPREALEAYELALRRLGRSG